MPNKELTDVLISGLTAAVADAETEASLRPPYPIPPGQAAQRDRLLAELVSRLPTTGDGPVTVTRIRGPLQSYRSAVFLLGQPGGFTFGDAACALLAVGALDRDDVDAIIGFVGSSSGLRRQLVLNRLAADDLAGARAEAAEMGEFSWVGCREIGAVLADRGDVKAFFTDWKHYAAGEERHRMDDLKVRLVIGVSLAEGWKAGLALTTDRRLGPRFARYVFTGYLADPDGLHRLFATDAAGVLSETDELSLLAEAIREVTDRDPQHDHPLLDEIVDRVIAVDFTTDKATMRWRDNELYSLWPAIGEQKTLDRARSAIRAPKYKRELKVLARDWTPKSNR